MSFKLIPIAAFMAMCAGCGPPDPSPDDLGKAPAPPPSLLTTYGKACSAAVGHLPPTWDCRTGKLLDIGEITTGAGGTKCTNPPWLGLGDQGRCIKGARLLTLPTDNPAADVRVICRRYKARDDFETNKFYEDVAVVASNRETGETCFFQARSDDPGKDGSDVPSPMADPASKDETESAIGKRAQDFWFQPDHLNQDALRCSLCHDNDAWMHSTYIDQVQGPNAVPKLGDQNRTRDQWSQDKITTPYKYQLVNASLFIAAGWPEPIGVRTFNVKDGNDKVNTQKCTECHRISSNVTNTGKEWITWATDGRSIKQRIQILDEIYHYMPSDEDDKVDETDWQKRLQNHVKAMKCCAKDPTKLGCSSYKILGIDQGTKAVPGQGPGKCVDNTGQVSLNTIIPTPAAALRSAGEMSCAANLSRPLCVDVTITHTLVDGTSLTITEDESGRSLGYCVPYDSSYTSEHDVYPGDVVELKLNGTAAWDASFNQLDFTSWSDPTVCPCEDPTSPTCRFTTQGATDRFGRNPDAPEFPGDPPQFLCAPQFAQSAPSSACPGPTDLGPPADLGPPPPRDLGAPSDLAQCGSSQSACSQDSDCCAPMVCVKGGDGDGGTNGVCSCAPQNYHCGTDANCCWTSPGQALPVSCNYNRCGGRHLGESCMNTNQCRDTMPLICPSGTCCEPVNATCTDSSQCCGPYTCSPNLIARLSCCMPDQSPCTTSQDCCNNYWGVGCSANHKCCVGSGQGCNTPGACCSGTCTNGRCP